MTLAGSRALPSCVPSRAACEGLADGVTAVTDVPDAAGAVVEHPARAEIAPTATMVPPTVAGALASARRRTFT
jgi:hypothetical protein